MVVVRVSVWTTICKTEMAGLARSTWFPLLILRSRQNQTIVEAKALLLAISIESKETCAIWGQTTVLSVDLGPWYRL